MENGIFKFDPYFLSSAPDNEAPIVLLMEDYPVQQTIEYKIRQLENLIEDTERVILKYEKNNINQTTCKTAPVQDCIAYNDAIVTLQKAKADLKTQQDLLLVDTSVPPVSRLAYTTLSFNNRYPNYRFTGMDIPTTTCHSVSYLTGTDRHRGNPDWGHKNLLNDLIFWVSKYAGGPQPTTEGEGVSITFEESNVLDPTHRRDLWIGDKKSLECVGKNFNVDDLFDDPNDPNDNGSTILETTKLDVSNDFGMQRLTCHHDNSGAHFGFLGNPNYDHVAILDTFLYGIVYKEDQDLDLVAENNAQMHLHDLSRRFNLDCNCEAASDCGVSTECISLTCDPDSPLSDYMGCITTEAPDSTSCTDSDGNACTTGACLQGVCAPTVPVAAVSDNNPCTNDYCDPKTGKTEYIPLIDGLNGSDATICADGDGDLLCSPASCQGGTCTDVQSTDPRCDEPEPLGCKVDADCALEGAGTACITGTCNLSTGLCSFAPKPIVDDDNPCTTQSCDLTLGMVTNNLPDGTLCHSSDPEAENCNVFTCQGGTCKGAPIEDPLDADSTPECSETCGNNEKEAPEQCDDGNQSDGDGCDISCHKEVCGDGVVNNNGAEECDDGNGTDGDGCSSVCKIEKADPLITKGVCESGGGVWTPSISDILNQGSENFDENKVELYSDESLGICQGASLSFSGAGCKCDITRTASSPYPIGSLLIALAFVIVPQVYMRRKRLN
ncbi:hypothetical protein K1X76_08055 [bacterium]|nr:hypothetical protein [bacterium]